MQKTIRLKNGPKSQNISKIDYSSPEFHQLSSGVPLYGLRTMGIGALRFELVFEAGRLYEHKKMVAQSCATILSEGCSGWSSEAFAEAFDFEGAYLYTYSSSDFITIRLTCAAKSFSRLVPLMKGMLTEPTFAQEELDIFIARKKQKMSINLTKNEVIGYRALTEGIYGADNQYGYNSMPTHLDEITTDDLDRHYRDRCVKEQASMFISGDYTQEHLALIEEMSEHLNSNPHSSPQLDFSTFTSAQSINIIGRENQSSLKLGLPLFSRQHADYGKVYILNTILGGYFGSRLMKNIREEKGYTYNIYSIMDTYKYAGSWLISCELDDKYVEKTMTEISNEFDRLKNHKMADQELIMVKNYLTGNFMSSINGPLKAISPAKTQLLMELNDTFYKDLFQNIQSLTTEDIRVFAKEYLNLDNFWKVIVGKA